jgi:DNA polymerase-3 subunit delta
LHVEAIDAKIMRNFTADTRMQLSFESLQATAEKNLRHTYLLSGEEIWQEQQAIDILRQIARKQGFEHTQRYDIDHDDTWRLFAQQTTNQSLFSEKTLHILRFTKNRLSKAGEKVLAQYWQCASPDHVIIVICGKMKPAEKKRAWVQQFEKQGDVLYTWPLFPNQLPNWLEQRLQYYRLSANQAAKQFILQHTQNNLLAAEQILLACSLSHAGGMLDEETLKQALHPHNQFTCYDLLDPLAAGNTQKLMTVIHTLQHDASHIPLLAFLLTQELQELISSGKPTYMNKAKTQRFTQWKQRLRRQDIPAIIKQLRTCEKACKGYGVLEPWQPFTRLCIAIATGERAYWLN